MDWSKRAAGLVLLAATLPASAQDTSAKMQAEIDELRATVKALQAEVTELKTSKQTVTSSQPTIVAAPKTQTQSAPLLPAPPLVPSESAKSAIPTGEVEPQSLAVESSGAVRQSVSDNPTGASRIDNEAPPTDPELKGFIQIPDSLTKLRLGGYTKLDAIYDFNTIGNNEQFVVPSIPVPRPPYDTGNFNLHARQTRFSLEVRHPTIFDQSMRFYLESDLYGGSSGQYQLRLRQAFGQLGNTYAGYGYSALMDVDSLPDTLDFAGPGAAVFLLQPSIHQAFHVGKTGSITLSVERPASEISTSVPGESVRGTQHLPDAVIAARTEHPWGHLQLSGVLRQVGYDNGVQTDRSTAGGVVLGGAWNLQPDANRTDLLVFSGLWGKGIAHFNSELGGSDLDAVVDSSGNVHPLESWGAYAGYTHYWNPDWRSNLVYGQNHVQESPWLATTAFRQSSYTATNLIWSPVPTLTMGMELIYGIYELQNGSSNHSTRIQGSLQYNFIR